MEGHRRDQACRDDALADIDDHDPERERLALRAQGVRAAGIATTQRANVHATAQPSHDETADERAKEIARDDFDDESAHTDKNISASMQRTLPPLSFSMVGTGTASTVSVQALRRVKLSGFRP